MGSIICRRDVHNLRSSKKLKMCIIVGTELSMNENTKRSQTETVINPLDMSEICYII